MAINTGQPFCNTTDGYLCEGKDIKGSYVVVADTTARDNLSAAAIMKGTLCYCQSDSKLYQYTGTDGTNTATSWKEKMSITGNTLTILF
jgi:hypothetical protein